MLLDDYNLNYLNKRENQKLGNLATHFDLEIVNKKNAEDAL